MLQWLHNFLGKFENSCYSVWQWTYLIEVPQKAIVTLICLNKNVIMKHYCNVCVCLFCSLKRCYQETYISQKITLCIEIGSKICIYVEIYIPICTYLYKQECAIFYILFWLAKFLYFCVKIFFASSKNLHKIDKNHIST